MVDFNSKAKHRLKVTKLVEERKQKTGEDEATAKKVVMKELRQKRKGNKEAKHKEAEKIKQDVEASMQGSDKKAIEKAVRKAVAKHFSQVKKSKKPGAALKAKAENFLVTVHSRLWRPSEKIWWDPECEHKFEDIQLLAAMNSIDLLKAPQNFGAMYPSECKQYFDFLAKKRFNAADPEAVKPGEVKANKSSLERKFEEKKVGEGVGKTDKELLEAVVLEVAEKEKAQALAQIRRDWKPSHKPWFNDKCAESFSNLLEGASSQGFDLNLKAQDFKKFKLKNKAVCKAHFQLMDETRTRFNEKQEAKEVRKTEAEKAKKEKDHAAAIPDGFAKGVNKKKTFDIDAADEDHVDVKNEGDIDNTIKKVDNKLKSLEKKKKKAEKKEKAEKKDQDKKELDPKKLKKIQKEKERRKRKKEAEEKAEEVKPEKGVVDFTQEDDEESTVAPKPKKNKKKKFSSEN